MFLANAAELTASEAVLITYVMTRKISDMLQITNR